MRVNANANADERTQANARTHLNNAEFYMPLAILFLINLIAIQLH